MADADFGVEALAGALGLSARHLARCLGAATGETPGALLRRLRLARAAALLGTGHGVGTVVAAVGYASRSQFSRAFREAYGVPPSAYTSAFAAESSRPGGRMSEMGTAVSGIGTYV